MANPPPRSSVFRDRLRAFAVARLDRRSHIGLRLTLALLVAGLAFWLFGALIDAVLDNATVVRFDLAAAKWIHQRVTPAGLLVFSGITMLGSPVTRTVLAIGGAILIGVRRHWVILSAWFIAFVGGELIQLIFKDGIARNRPEYGARYLHGQSFSFPSGHAMGSAIMFSMAAYVLLLYWHPPRSWRRAIVLLAIVTVVAVAVSRVYLGVHYPSDVVAGVAAGAAWAAVCIGAIQIALQRHLILSAAKGPSPHPDDRVVTS
jgi:membrane-associated phospholipid phosphatase